MMSEGLNPLELVLNASIIVQIVMALLLLASIISWSIMLRKRAELNRARGNADRFEEVFWSGGDLTAMFRAIDQGRRVTKGMEAIFESGFREFSRMRQQGGFASAQLLEGARRGMRVALLKESDRLEHSLSMLATVGSTSPYVGLFGTVWGIMTSFQSIAASKNTSLAVVAPGIAEALFATALGLVAAIPATIFYNKLSSEVSRLAQRLEGFADEFSAILSRQVDERS